MRIAPGRVKHRRPQTRGGEASQRLRMRWRRRL